MRFWMFEPTNSDRFGVFHGTVGFMPNAGKGGPQTGGIGPGHDGSLVVGRFKFRLPLAH